NIEINNHWTLDVSFKEDLNRVRIGHAAENLATIRRIALNLLKPGQRRLKSSGSRAEIRVYRRVSIRPWSCTFSTLTRFNMF
ncbi:hypothetical protein ACN4Z3_17275, partial [Legionella sp. 29fVS95]